MNYCFAAGIIICIIASMSAKGFIPPLKKSMYSPTPHHRWKLIFFIATGWRDNWFPVTTAWRILGLRMEERPLVWRVKQSPYRPGVAQRVPGSYGSQISWQRHRKVVRLSTLHTGRLYPQEILLVLIYVRGWVNPRAIVRSKELYQWKIPPATFPFLAQHLNPCATAVPPIRMVAANVSNK